MAEGLDESQRETLLQFQEIVASDDSDESIQTLQKYSWNLEAAVQSTFNANEGLPSSYDNIEVVPSQESPVSAPTAVRRTISPGLSAVDYNRQNSWLQWLRSFAVLPFHLVHATYSFSYHCLTEFVLFVVRIIFPNFGRTPSQPIEDVMSFKENYEAEYGTDHPTFYQGSYSQILQDCKKELKFLLVYLHSKDHQDTPQFCRNVLANPGFREYINGNMLFWGCDVSSNEGYRVSKAMREQTYPFLAVVCLRDNRMAIVWRIEGYMEVDQVIAICAQVIDENEPYLVAVREDRRVHSDSQEIRKEQDAAYLESLAMDRQKEEEKKQQLEALEKEKQLQQEKENEKLRKIEEVKLKRENCRKIIADTPEPLSTDPGSVQIRVKLPDGMQLQRYFLQSDQLQLIYDFVLSHEESPCEFLLSSNYPRKSFPIDTASKSLEECGINKSLAMFIQNLADSSSDEDED